MNLIVGKWAAGFGGRGEGVLGHRTQHSDQRVRGQTGHQPQQSHKIITKQET